jgi:hypothetical protein
MKYLLNLGFLHGQQLTPDRITSAEPALGELTVENWPPKGIKRFTRFRRVAIFRQADEPEPFCLYDPELTRVTPIYMELTGHEQHGTTFRTQSWILREAPHNVSFGFCDPEEDDRVY